MKIFDNIPVIKKSIQERNYNDSKIEYHIEFNIIVNYIVFGHSFISSNLYNDKIIFETKEQAEDYINNVDQPSKWKYDDGGEYGYPKYYVYLKGIIRNDEIKNALKKYGHSTKYKIRFEPPFESTKKTKPPYGQYKKIYTLSYDAGSISGYSISEVINCLINRISFSTNTLKTVTTVDKTPIEMDVDKIKTKRHVLIEKELERVNEYKKHLESLL